MIGTAASNVASALSVVSAALNVDMAVQSIDVRHAYCLQDEWGHLVTTRT